MKTRFVLATIPERLTAVVSADGRPSEGLLIVLSLQMARKNPFNFVFGPSNEEGKVEVSRKEIEREVGRTLKLFPLDYDPSSFNGRINIVAMSYHQLDSALAAYDIYHQASGYPSGYREKLTTALTTLGRLEPKRLNVKIT